MSVAWFYRGSIFRTLFFSYMALGFMLGAAISGLYLGKAFAVLREESRGRLEAALGVASEVFEYECVNKVEQDLHFVNESLFLNNYLSSRVNERLLAQGDAQRLMLQYTGQPDGLYFSARFVDIAGNEKIAVAGRRRIRDYSSLARHPEDEYFSRFYRLYARLRTSAPGTILSEGPFWWQGRLTYFAGISKSDPDVGGFAGAFIFHCDASHFLASTLAAISKSRFAPHAHFYDGSGKLLYPHPEKDDILVKAREEVRDAFQKGSRTFGLGADSAFAAIEVVLPGKILRDMLAEIIMKVVGVMGALILCVGIFAFLVARSLSIPLTRTTEALRRVAAGDLSARVDYKSKGESGDLIAGFNAMAQRLQSTTVSSEEFRRERNRAQQYLDIAGVMLVALDSRGVVTLANKKTCAILGVSEPEIIGKDWIESFVSAEQRPQVKTVFASLMGCRGDYSNAENEVMTRSGERRSISWHNVALKNEAGEVVGTLSSGEDVTSRRKAQEEQQSLIRDLEEANMIMVGRELRMIELKQQVNGLLAELGRERAYEDAGGLVDGAF